MANIMILFGSGGHSTEMLMLIQHAKLANRLKSGEIKRVVCTISEDDNIVEEKVVKEFEDNQQNLDIVKLKRARSVGQSYLTAIWTTLASLLNSISIVFNQQPNICLTNGPSISVTVLLAIRLLQIMTLGRRYNCEIIYVESFCRTRDLSLSGKIIYYLGLANHFVVQWPVLKNHYPRSLYKGIVV